MGSRGSQQILDGRRAKRASIVTLTLLGVVLPIVAMAHGFSWAPLLAWAIGSAIIGGHLYRRAGDRAVWALLARAYRRLVSGRLDAAEASLIVAAKQHPPRHLARLIHLQQATIALRRGALAQCKLELDAALALTHAPRWRDPGVRRDATATHGMRAFVRAAVGDTEGALRDVSAVWADASASADDLARAALAQAVLIQRQGDRDALRVHIDRHRTLLYEHTHPRDREIVRAFDRMGRATARAAYRQRAGDMPSADVREEPPLAEWVGRIAPDAVLYLKPHSIGGASAGSKMPSPRPTERGLAAMRHARGKRTGDVKGWPSLVAWSAALAYVGFLIGALFGLPRTSYTDSTEAPILLFAVLFGALPWALRMLDPVRARLRARHLRALGPAISALHRGDEPKAELLLSELSSSRDDVVGAQAHLTLAGLAERRGDLTTTLLHCDRGLARLRREHAQLEAGVLLPDLMSLRALALSSMGLYEEARTEVAHLPRAYAHRRLALFRTRLVELATAGDTRSASAWIDEYGGDLSLSSREELLTDVIRAVHAPDRVGEAELTRLRDEATRSGSTSKWLDAVAPRIVAQLVDGTHEPARRVAPIAAEARDVAAEAREIAAEAEHRAEQEAAGVASLPSALVGR